MKKQDPIVHEIPSVPTPPTDGTTRVQGIVVPHDPLRKDVNDPVRKDVTGAATGAATESIASEQSQVQMLAAQVAALTEMLGQMQISQAAQAAQAAQTFQSAQAEHAAQLTALSSALQAQQYQAQAVGMGMVRSSPAYVPLSGGTFVDSNVYYIRIKPFDVHRKHLRLRQYVDELGCVVRGGTGAPGDIPQWHTVDPMTAQKLMRYRQDNDDPASPPVFDIVTPEEREQLDRYEESYRMSAVGISSAPPLAIQRAVHGRLAPQQNLSIRQPPSVVHGAQSAVATLAQQHAQAQLLQPHIVNAPLPAPLPPQPQAPIPVYQQPPVQVAGSTTMAPSPVPSVLAGRAAAATVATAMPGTGPGETDGGGMDLSPLVHGNPEITQLVATSEVVARQAAAELGRSPLRGMR